VEGRERRREEGLLEEEALHGPPAEEVEEDAWPPERVSEPEEGEGLEEVEAVEEADEEEGEGEEETEEP